MSFSPLRAALLAAAAVVAVSSASVAQQPAPAAAPAPAASAPAVSPVVAKVDGVEIRRAELEALLPQLPPQFRQMPFEMIFDALLEQVVNQKLIQSAGYAAGLQNSDAVKAELQEAERRAVQRVFLTKKLDERMTPEALDNAYKAFVAANPPAQEVRASHILVESEDEAKKIIADLKKGGDFAKLAKEKSKDKVAGEQGGDLGYFTKDMMVEAFANAAFAMKKGEVSAAPVKSEFGWHIIRVEDQREKPVPTRAEAEPQLRQQLAEELVTGMLDELRGKSKVELFQIDGSPRPAAPAPTAPAPAKP
jgi:peptidyl-prolyl cis-trans isomerase C